MKYVALVLAAILTSPDHGSDIQRAWDQHLACREVESTTLMGLASGLAMQESVPVAKLETVSSVLDAHQNGLAALYKLRIELIRQGVITENQAKVSCPPAPKR